MTDFGAILESHLLTSKVKHPAYLVVGCRRCFVFVHFLLRQVSSKALAAKAIKYQDSRFNLQRLHKHLSLSCRVRRTSQLHLRYIRLERDGSQGGSPVPVPWDKTSAV